MREGRKERDNVDRGEQKRNERAKATICKKVQKERFGRGVWHNEWLKIYV
jgi:ribosomal protein L37AE/L43A